VSETDGECPLERSVRANNKVTAVYSRVNGPNLQYFRIDVFPLPDDMGKPRYMLTRDNVTDLMQLQQRVQEAEKMAAIGELSTYIAHEIRNPLFAIGGFANALMRTPSLDESGREKAGIILEESQRLDGILKSILNFSKPVETDIGTVDLEKVVSQTVKIMSMGDEGRQVQTSLETIEKIPHARGNADLLKQCLINIIKNAHEAMPEGGKISVRLAQAGDMIEIAVTDTGVGIKDEAIAQIFNPFFSTKNKGAGLGLAMTKKLIQDMGGKLELSSKVGVGTSVRILLLPDLGSGDSGEAPTM
jgi:signal transduction histidine kinase